MQSILIVDDEKNTRDGLCKALCDEFDVFAASNADEAIRMLDAENFDAVITDLKMSGKTGMSVIDKAISVEHRPVCIMLTAYANVEMAVEAMKRGADDFISKPVDIDRLENSLETLLAKRERQKAERLEKNSEHIRDLRERKIETAAADISTSNYESGAIIAESAVMRAVIKTAETAAKSRATVLITGETGTGKELVARLIHSMSPRRENVFLPVHCAAIPDNLLESELFGYEKGAFTGAIQRRIGRFEAADKGTIFLDEIGEIDAATQVKLLRFLESRTFERIGSNTPISVDVRIVCATNRNLREMAERGDFREDLYYRLNVVEIKMPPLRDHPEDIPPMVEAYTNFFAKENNLAPVSVSRAAMDALLAYKWAGNVRELRNFCENMAVMHAGESITPELLDPKFFEPARVDSAHPETPQTQPSPASAPKQVRNFSAKENEFELIREAIAASDGNKTKAAEKLGISRRTLHRKLREMDGEK